MGNIDTMAKKYFQNPVRYANLFNYLLYDGAPVIKPEELTEMNPTEMLVFDKDAVQKHRDLLFRWSHKEEGYVMEVFLGTELQVSIHYAIPIKDTLYDILNYSDQVNALSKEHREDSKNGATVTTAGAGKLPKMTSGEFLSGLYKEDRLILSITATVFLSPERWTGPKSLRDMYSFRDKRIKKPLPNYPVYLITPCKMDEDDFNQMGPLDLGFLMKAIKLGKAGIGDIISDPRYQQVDRETVILVNEINHMGLRISEEQKGGPINMCEAMKNNNREQRVLGSIGMAYMTTNDEAAVVKLVCKALHESPAYVRARLKKYGEWKAEEDRKWAERKAAEAEKRKRRAEAKAAAAAGSAAAAQ